VTGTWAFGYDTLNRLTAANASSGPYSGESGCWNYDAFGNRTVEAFSTQTTTPCAQGANDNAQYTVTTPTALNQVSGFQYDAAGNVLNDGKNNYWYDAEGRLCAVAYPNGSGGAYYEQYLYDAEGRRVGKVPASSLSCAAPTGAPTNQYLLGLGGEQVTEVNGLGAPLHTNAYAGGKLLATYDFINGGLHFVLTDPLGTKRVQISATGTAELNCQSLPFGNDLGNPRVTDCVVPTNGVGAPDATEHHFTGKERDAESGNDFFTARYYASSFGRFASPDDGSDQNPSDPQSWNLYSYVRNNALSNTDLDGHGCQKTIFSHLDANGNRVVDDTVWDLSDCFFGFVDTTINVTKSTANAFSQAISQTTQHAPNNGPTWSQQNKNCLNTINNTPDGKFYNTFSYTSALIGPDASLLAAGQDAASEGAQRGALGFLKATAKNWGSTALGSGSGFAANVWEAVDGFALTPLAVAATAGQLTVHAGCAISAAF
jgi:RHS repeat-associated protein